MQRRREQGGAFRTHAEQQKRSLDRGGKYSGRRLTNTTPLFFSEPTSISLLQRKTRLVDWEDKRRIRDCNSKPFGGWISSCCVCVFVAAVGSVERRHGGAILGVAAGGEEGAAAVPRPPHDHARSGFGSGASEFPIGWDGSRAGGQFNSFVEISTDSSTEFLVLQGVPHYYKNSVEKSDEKSVEIPTKLLN